MSQYLTFLWPWMLLALVAVPLLVWYYIRLRKERSRVATAMSPLVPTGNDGGDTLRRRRAVPPILFLAGLTLLIISLARPQALVSLPRIQGTVILAFDVSASMTADDLEPSRLEAAKAAAQEFVNNQPSSIQIGVVAFGSGAMTVQQPTSDHAAILSSIDRLSAQGGTSLGQGIFTSLNAIAGERVAINEEAINADAGAIDVEQLQIEDYSSAVILLLTDGENLSEPDPLEIAQVAAEAGVRVYTIGIGSQEGALVEIDGFNIVTQLDEPLLQEIASVTNGAYYRAEDQEELSEIYKHVDLQLTVDPEMTEVTALFAGAALPFLLAGSLLSMLWFGRAP